MRQLLTVTVHLGTTQSCWRRSHRHTAAALPRQYSEVGGNSERYSNTSIVWGGGTCTYTPSAPQREKYCAFYLSHSIYRCWLCIWREITSRWQTTGGDLCFSNNNTAAKFLKGVLPSKHLLSNVWIRVFGARRFLDRVIIITCECNQSLNFTVNTFTSDSWKRVAANSCKENKLVTQLLYSVAVLSTQSIDIYSLIYQLELNKYQFFIF